MTRIECRAAALRTHYHRMSGLEVRPDHFRDLPEREQMRWKKAVRELHQLTDQYLEINGTGDYVD